MLLHDGLVVPGVLAEELAAALDLVEAYGAASSNLPGRRRGLSRGVWAVREVARQAAVQFREQQQAHAANAAANAPVVTVLVPAKAAAESVSEITTEQAATIAGVTEARIRQLATAGVIEGRKTSRNVWLLDPGSVRAYAHRRGGHHGDHTHRGGHRGPAGAGAA
ncbi:hypothetical protein ACH47Z_18150 [Streptomyces sp. NPDC020192]|uniref:hypothetical protein n=1 Tax=Streptomyces sp. NPDC020192 TaxID=3365066 RepID=UPI00378C7AFE